MPMFCPLLLITFFGNCTTHMIMAQDNNFQEIFIINVLELIMVKQASICRTCCMGLYFQSYQNATITYVFKRTKIANPWWVLTLVCDIYCDIHSTWFLRCFWELTFFDFVPIWTHVLCFTCNIETWQSLSVGWAWLSNCFSRLSTNLCCLFQALSNEMCFTAEYLKRKHDLTWRNTDANVVRVNLRSETRYCVDKIKCGGVNLSKLLLWLGLWLCDDPTLVLGCAWTCRNLVTWQRI